MFKSFQSLIGILADFNSAFFVVFKNRYHVSIPHRDFSRFQHDEASDRRASWRVSIPHRDFSRFQQFKGGSTAGRHCPFQSLIGILADFNALSPVRTAPSVHVSIPHRDFSRFQPIMYCRNCFKSELVSIPHRDFSRFQLEVNFLRGLPF